MLVKIKSIVAVCKIYDFGYFTYKHMRFVKACQPTAAQITTATTTTKKKNKKKQQNIKLFKIQCHTISI